MNSHMTAFNRITSLLVVILLLGYGLPAVHAVPAGLSPRQFTQEDPTVPPAAWTLCEGGANATTVIESAPWGPDGIVRTIGKCSGSENSVSPDDVTAKLKLRREDYGLDKRAPSCPRPATSCGATSFSGYVPQCGASCTSTCYKGTGGPDPNDCQTIFNGFSSRSDRVFALEPNFFVLHTFRTCGTGIQNQILQSQTDSSCPTRMIYDYPDWAAVGGYLAWNCQAAQGARGGQCLGDRGLYIAGSRDFYIQVYRN